MEAPPCENYPQKFSPEKIAPYEIPPHLQIIQMKVKSKKQNFLPRRKLCNTTSLSKLTKVPFYTDDLTENTGLRYLQNQKNPKIKRKRKLPNGIYLAVAQVKEN